MIAFTRSTATPPTVKVDTEAAKFLRKFYEHDRHQVIRAPYDLRPEWKTYEYIGLDELLKVWADLNELVGVRPGSVTNQWTGDIDTGSQYHPHREVKEDWSQVEKIRDVLLGIGLESELFYSSHRGGIHIRVFLPEMVKSIDLGAAIEYALRDAGFELKNGQLEASPRIKDYSHDEKKIVQYQAFRLPMQQGGAYIGIGHEIETGYEGLEGLAYIIQKNSECQDMEMLKAAMEVAAERLYRENAERYKYLIVRGTAAQFKEGLELRMFRGFSGFGETNELMKETLKYGYIFLHLEGAELAEWLEETMENMPGYRQYCRHQKEMARKARTWVRWIEKCPKYYPYGSRKGQSSPAAQTQEPKINKNESKSTEAIVKLKLAVYKLKAEGKKFSKVVDLLAAIRAIVDRAFSSRTLYKEEFKKIWSQLLETPLAKVLNQKTATENPVPEAEKQNLGSEGVTEITYPEKSQNSAQKAEIQKPCPEGVTEITYPEPIECLAGGELERLIPSASSSQLNFGKIEVSGDEQPEIHTQQGLQQLSLFQTIEEAGLELEMSVDSVRRVWLNSYLPAKAEIERRSKIEPEPFDPDRCLREILIERLRLFWSVLPLSWADFAQAWLDGLKLRIP